MTNTRMTDTATLADMATLPSDKVKRAVEAGDWAEAARTFEREEKEIRREFAPIALGHSRMISAVLDLLAGMIRERQNALTGKLGEAVAAQDSAGAIEAIDKKRAEHSHYQRACVQFLTQLYSYALDIGGPAGLCELQIGRAHV